MDGLAAVLTLSRIGKSGISSGEIKFIDIRRKAGGEGNSLGPD